MDLGSEVIPITSPSPSWSLGNGEGWAGMAVLVLLPIFPLALAAFETKVLRSLFTATFHSEWS